MKSISMKFFFTVIWLVVYASMAGASTLPVGAIKTTASCSFNNLSGKRLSTMNLPTMRELRFKEQLPKIAISAGVIDDLQLDFSFNSFNMHLFHDSVEIDKTRIHTIIGALGFTTSLFSMGNYGISTQIATHIGFSPSGEVDDDNVKDSKFEKIKGTDFIFKAITLNNAHSYKFNNDMRLIALHKNFINVRFNEKKYRIKIAAPLTLYLPIIENLNVNLNTVLYSWDNGEDEKYESNFQSIWHKIPASLDINYTVNDSFNINTNVNIINHIGDLSKTIDSLGFSISLSCRSNMI